MCLYAKTYYAVKKFTQGFGSKPAGKWHIEEKEGGGKKILKRTLKK
jgi:hypothetical protein